MKTGFTLIELIVVIAIIAVLATVVRKSAIKIDETVDDGELTTASVQQAAVGGDMGWVLVWDPW